LSILKLLSKCMPAPELVAHNSCRSPSQLSFLRLASRNIFAIKAKYTDLIGNPPTITSHKPSLRGAKVTKQPEIQLLLRSARLVSFQFSNSPVSKITVHLGVTSAIHGLSNYQSYWKHRIYLFITHFFRNITKRP
jgi:hypothetical protein